MIKCPKVIEDIKRRKIRYVLFRTQNEYVEGTDPLDPNDVDLTPGQVKAIQKHYLTNEFHITKFATEWDIGIDDIDTMVNRKEKYWCFGISRYRHVVRPVKEFYVPVPAIEDEDGNIVKAATMRPEMRPFADSEAQGIQFMAREGFAKELSENHWDYDYQKILEGVPDRTTWV